MRLSMILIYRRRKEFVLDPRLSKQQASLLTANDEQLMSFDRLVPDPLPFLGEMEARRVSEGSRDFPRLRVRASTTAVANT